MAGNTYVLRQGGSGYELGTNVGNASLLLGAGTSSTPFTTATANTNHMEFRLQNSATSGDNRGMYLRLYLSGAGGGGDALRAFATVSDVAAGTVHGAHISLNFASTGTVTGQGIAGRFTLHIPNVALTSNVTMAPVLAEIWSDGATSDPGGSTKLAYIICNNGGNATGAADVDDDASLISITGHTIGAANMIVADVDETKFSHKARIDIDGVEYFIMLANS